ncbi:MAG: hypothetical protein AAGA54_15825, partial [Myxococcota bacterium]
DRLEPPHGDGASASAQGSDRSPRGGSIGVAAFARRASAGGEGGDTDRAAARASVAALGRCGGPVAMRRLKAILTDANGDMELRAEAARRLAKHGGPDGAKAVISLLDARPEPALARRLASALRHAPTPTPAIDEALCAELQEPGPVARASADALRELHPDRANPCADLE